MTFQSSNDLYGFPQPLTSVFPAPIKSLRAPATSDFHYQIGQVWVDTANSTSYILSSVVANSATWNIMATNPSTFTTLTADSGGAVSPSGGGNISLLGTASQIAAVGTPGSNLITFSFPSAITAPGSLTTTTGLTAGS